MATRHVTYLTIKSVQRDGERWIEGWATTGSLDRQGDIVVPEGAEFTLPLPLLFAHKHDEPIGSVIEAKVSKAGIRIRAKLTAGVARAEEIWKLLVDGALNAVSIGFQALEQTPLPGGGYRYDRWAWWETSVVSVGANPDARISVGKSAAYAVKVETPPAFTLPAFKPEPSHKVKRVTFADIDLIEYSKELGALIREALAPIKARLDALEGSTTDRGIKYMGRYNRDISYERGDMVTHAASLWIASHRTRDAPGACSDWQRMLTADKRGQPIND